MKRKLTAWYYWFPDEGDTQEDCRERRYEEDRDVALVAEDIAEQKWHRDSPDHFDEITIAIVDPRGEWHTVRVSVECVPSFRACVARACKEDAK